MPKHTLGAAAEGLPDTRTIEDQFEDLMSQAHGLRCMAHVSEMSIEDVLFPGVRSPAGSEFYYVGNISRDVIGFAVGDVVTRVEALARDLAALQNAVKLEPSQC